jgi:hypothetical protein
MSAKRIHLIWYKSRIFKEYQRPALETIIAWVEEFNKEVYQTRCCNAQPYQQKLGVYLCGKCNRIVTLEMVMLHESPDQQGKEEIKN